MPPLGTIYFLQWMEHFPVTGADMAAKLIVTTTDGGSRISLVGTSGTELLTSKVFTEPRAKGATLRSLKGLLGDDVVIDDQTVAAGRKPADGTAAPTPRKAAATAPAGRKAAAATPTARKTATAAPSRGTRKARSTAAGEAKSQPVTKSAKAPAGRRKATSPRQAATAAKTATTAAKTAATSAKTAATKKASRTSAAAKRVTGKKASKATKAPQSS